MSKPERKANSQMRDVRCAGHVMAVSYAQAPGPGDRPGRCCWVVDWLSSLKSRRCPIIGLYREGGLPIVHHCTVIVQCCTVIQEGHLDTRPHLLYPEIGHGQQAEPQTTTQGV